MAGLERDSLPSIGGAFWREDDVVQFRFVIDPGNVIGPRPATRADQENHAGAWAAFCAAEEVHPLDRDAKDGPGGSLTEGAPPATAVEPQSPFDHEHDGEATGVLPHVAAEERAPPETIVKEKDMAAFAERLEPVAASRKRHTAKRRG